MTQKELKDSILLALYQRYKEGKDNYVDPLSLCEEEQIGYDSAEALGYALPGC